jgi:hypothetical protein
MMVSRITVLGKAIIAGGTIETALTTVKEFTRGMNNLTEMILDLFTVSGTTGTGAGVVRPKNGQGTFFYCIRFTAKSRSLLRSLLR